MGTDVKWARDEASERVVIGCCLRDSGALGLAAERLTPAHFFRDSYGLIFRAALELRRREIPVNVYTVGRHLQDGDALRDAGGTVTLAGIVDELETLINDDASPALVGFAIEKVIEAREKHQLAAALRAADVRVRNNGLPVAVLRSQIGHDLEELGVFSAAPGAGLGGFALHRVSVEDLDVDHPPEGRYLIRPILAVGNIALLVGRWGFLKTWLILDLILAAITGGVAWGRFTFAQAIRVVLVDEENGEGLILRRLAALARGRGITTAEFPALVRERLRIYADSGFNFRNPAAVELLRHEIGTFGAELLLLESLVRVQRADDENASAEANALFLDGLRPIAHGQGTAVLVTHHVRKRSGQQGMNEPGERIRGTGDLAALADQVLVLVEGESPDEPLLIHVKAREGERAPGLLVKLLPGDEGGLVVASREPGGVRASRGGGGKAGAAKTFIVAALARTGQGGLTREQIIAAAVPAGFSENTVKRAIQAVIGDETVAPVRPERGAPLRLVEGI